MAGWNDITDLDPTRKHSKSLVCIGTIGKYLSSFAEKKHKIREFPKD